jgi:hypothetical protein
MNKVRTDKIDVNDSSYCISYPLEDVLLASSIERFGVLVPIGLLESDPACVVTGFRRIAAAKKAGIDEIPYVLLDVSEKEAVLIAINDNLKRPLNTIEKARCLEKMIVKGFPAEDVYATARMIGLPVREKTLETVVAMGSFGEAAKSLVLEHNLSLAVVEQLLSFDEDERTLIVRMMSRLNGTSSYLREALQLLMLLKIRQGGVDLLQWEGVKDMEALIRELNRVTHPLLAGFEERLGRIREASALPPHIKIQVDPVFEKESIDIQVRARNDVEVEEALKKLVALSKQGVFRSIFELTHGTPERD